MGHLVHKEPLGEKRNLANRCNYDHHEAAVHKTVSLHMEFRPHIRASGKDGSQNSEAADGKKSHVDSCAPLMPVSPESCAKITWPQLDSLKRTFYQEG